jgi:hypothetical protein
VATPERLRSPQVRALRDWLVAEASGDGASGDGASGDGAGGMATADRARKLSA